MEVNSHVKQLSILVIALCCIVFLLVMFQIGNHASYSPSKYCFVVHFSFCWLSVLQGDISLQRSTLLLIAIVNTLSAHTKDSAKALVDTVRMAFPDARVALVVAMASDKDHLAFAREFLSGLSPLYFEFLLYWLSMISVEVDNMRKMRTCY